MDLSGHLLASHHEEWDITRQYMYHSPISNSLYKGHKQLNNHFWGYSHRSSSICFPVEGMTICGISFPDV